MNIETGRYGVNRVPVKERRSETCNSVEDEFHVLMKCPFVVSLAEIITNVDEVDLIMFNSISNPIQKSNKNNLDVVQLAASVRVTI